MATFASTFKPDGEFEVARIEIYQMIGPPGRNVVQQFLGQIAVGVNDPDSMSKGDVLDDQVPQEGGLAGTGFSDDVDVLALIRGRYAKRLRLPPAVTFSNHNVGLVYSWFQNQSPLLPQRSPRVVGFPWWLEFQSPAKCFGARRRGNGDWF